MPYEDTTKLTITDWAEEDRPRERLERLGAEALSNAELLAILIGSGTPEKSAVDLMKEILADCGNNLNQLAVLANMGKVQFANLDSAVQEFSKINTSLREMQEGGVAKSQSSIS